jgi:hypothetical protein
VSRRRSLALACAALAPLAGCLDAGPTPLGRHLVTSRAPEQVQLVDGAVGAPRRILLTRNLPPANALQLSTEEISTVDDPGPGGGASEARVIAGEVTSTPHCQTPDCPTPIDSLGRIYLYRPSFVPFPGGPQGAVSEVDNLVRVDPASGAQRDFGVVQYVELSADRTRAVIEPQPKVLDPTTPQYLVVDIDDSMTSLAIDGGQFAGDDFYVLAADRLSRLPRGKRALEDIATNIRLLAVYPTTRGPLIVLTTVGPMRMIEGGVSSFLDPTTLTMEALPPATAAAWAGSFFPSSLGRYVATAHAPPYGAPNDDTTTLTIYDRDTGQEAVQTQPGAVSNPAWRPGRDEVWFESNNVDLFRWKVSGQPEKVGPAVPGFGFFTFEPRTPQMLATQGDPVFTPDGQFRVVPEGQSERALIDLVWADDATAPPFVLNQPSLGIAALWPLVDGRLLVENFLTDSRNNDVFLADPVARTQRQLASGGNVVATGRDRCLALLHWVATGGSGDLTIIDYATGAETLVAENVHSVAVDAAADANDALAPGTRVAFLVRNRIASPYDGLWVLELP